MTYKRFLLGLCLLVIITGCASNLNLQEGIQNFQMQNYRAAFIHLKPEAEKGNPDAQYAVGYMYYYGQGVTEDKKQALFWISAAAKAGQPSAIAAMQMLSPPPMITEPPTPTPPPLAPPPGAPVAQFFK